MINELYEPEVVKKVAEFLALGYSSTEIKEELEKMLKRKIDGLTVRNLVKTLAVKKREIIQTDKEFSELYKSLLTELIGKARENLKILETTRSLVLDTLDEIKENANTKSQGVLDLKDCVEELKNTKDWVVVANKAVRIMKILEKPEFKSNFSMIAYIREVNSAIRTQNDSIRTFIDILRQLEGEGKETKVSTVQSIYVLANHIKQLEKDGYVKVIKKLPEHLEETDE